MTYGILITIYLLLFTILTWKKFDWGLFLFFLLLPTYLIRFNIGPLPTTLLEIMFGIIFLIWLFRQVPHIPHSTFQKFLKENKLLIIGIGLFIIASTISIFTSTNLRSALGEWKAFYIEPIIMFLILITYSKQNSKFNIQHSIFYPLILSGLLTSILAIIQHFTGWLVPEAFWSNNNTFRVTAWYSFPNGVGLFLAPLWPLALYSLRYKIQDINKFQIPNSKFNFLKIKNWSLFVSCTLYLVLSPLAIFYAKSTGALIGLVAGIGIILLANKKTRCPAIIIAIICFASLISLTGFSSLKDEVFFQDRSGQIRLSMWSDTFNFLKDHPIKGAGLASYSEKIESYHTTVGGEGIEIFHHPHNIFLTMWVNLGLLGLISFLIILISIIKNCFQISNFKFQIFILSSFVIIFTMGLVDSPYIKNDLAMFFWLLPALIIIQKYENLENT